MHAVRMALHLLKCQYTSESFEFDGLFVYLGDILPAEMYQHNEWDHGNHLKHLFFVVYLRNSTKFEKTFSSTQSIC